ncbi:MAG TPA: helix-turn-helix domain-containing protein [Acidimicrobiales bacterium]|nr:helix-turn-helix domain-containing protein [Acidimicrobiales bacterium]
MATQEERRADTRQRLLDAAAELFAERGIEASSVDAIAERAERTSGAVYDHFDGKQGLLFALLEGWVDDVAVAIGAEMATATSLDERLASIWRNVTDPPTGDGRWIALEHELWSYAARNESARDHLARRYRAAWEGVDEAVADWNGDASRVGPALIGLLLGLEMMRRVDPDALTDEMAIAALRGVVAATTTGVRT